DLYIRIVEAALDFVDCYKEALNTPSNQLLLARPWDWHPKLRQPRSVYVWLACSARSVCDLLPIQERSKKRVYVGTVDLGVEAHPDEVTRKDSIRWIFLEQVALASRCAGPGKDEVAAR